MTLQEQIDSIDKDTRDFIMSCDNVQELIALKKIFNNPTISNVVNARIENITYLAV